MARGKHDAKRAQRFVDSGIDVADLAFSETAYIGEGGGTCCLCDTPIKYCFSLAFRSRPGRDDVTMVPVGSQCITDWMRALPDCPEREAALARVKDAERERNRLMRAKQAAEREVERRAVARRECVAAFDGPEADIVSRYFDLVDGGRAAEGYARWATLVDIGRRVERYRSFVSGKQAGLFSALVREAEAAIVTPEERRVAFIARLAGDNAEHANLMARYYAIPEEHRCETLLDIAGGVERFGHFRTDRQARFFAVRLRDAEMKVPPPPAPAHVVRAATDAVVVVNGDVDAALSVARPEHMDDFPFFD